MTKISKILFIGLLIINLLSYNSINGQEKRENEHPKVEFDFSKIDKSKFPNPIGKVNDFEKILSIEQIENLEKIISDFEKLTTNQIAIVTIESIGDYTDFNKYSLDLSNYWGVGQIYKDNGLTIVFSNKLKKIRINSGTGTEKILTDQILQNILNQKMIPEFKNGDYYNGLKNGLEQIITEWN